MIDTQTGDAGDCGFDEDVCAIVFTADATFDDCGVDTLAHVRMVCHQGQEPEIDGFGGKICRLAFGSGGTFEAVPCFEEVSCESLLGERLIIDLDTFTNEAEVWGSIESDLAESWS